MILMLCLLITLVLMLVINLLVLEVCLEDLEEDVVEVEDEGEGVPAEVRESLFEAFVSTKAAGIGLGLAVVKRIVDEHGARIELESGSTGTQFRLTFR